MHTSYRKIRGAALSLAAACIAVPCFVEARPCVSQGTEPILCGETVECALPDSLGEHRYRFDASPGEVVQITIASDTCTACWELFDGDEQRIGDKVCLPACNEPFLIARSSRQLSDRGPYTIVVTSAIDVSASYSLSLQPLGATFDGEPSCAAAISCGETVQAQFTSFADTDTYRFEASPTEVVRIALNGESCNACWELFDKNGGAVGERECQPFCETSAVVDVRQLPESGGPFTIVVSQYASASVFYRVSLQPFTAPSNGAKGCGCDNGIIERGEDCDAGAGNGSATSCCTALCRFETSAKTCRPSAGECDVSESCSGTSGTCAADARKPNLSPCTDDGGVCTADVCDGTSITCSHPLTAPVCGDGQVCGTEACDPPGEGAGCGEEEVCNAACACVSNVTTTTTATTTTSSSTSSSSTTVTTSSTTTSTVPCESARCMLDAGLTSSACAGQTVPLSITKKFDRAAGLIERAGTDSTKQAVKLRKRAKSIIKEARGKAARAAKGRRPKVSADCAGALRGAADGVVSGLGV